MKGEIIDSSIVAGSLVSLNQRLKYVPKMERESPGFDASKLRVPVWQVVNGKSTPYESIPTGSLAAVIDRYVENEVTKFEVLVNGQTYRCYGVHADLVEAQ